MPAVNTKKICMPILVAGTMNTYKERLTAIRAEEIGKLAFFMPAMSTNFHPDFFVDQ